MRIVFGGEINTSLIVNFVEERPYVDYVAGIKLFNKEHTIGRAFACSCSFLIGLLLSAAFGLYPDVLPSLGTVGATLTVENAVAPVDGLHSGLIWFVPGLFLAFAYSAYVHWKFSGKILEETRH